MSLDDVSAARALRQGMMGDPQHPHYHFLPPANWMNDPNGLIQWKGEYHLFYQYNPHGAFHALIHWGHAVSPDLVHWADLPLALTPTPGRADADGCWSGCAVDNNGVPTLVYSGLAPQVVCLATSADDLLTWQYYPGNPVISGPPPEVGTNGHFRDPFVWREGDFWYLLMGSNTAGVAGTILLYRSPDLIHWDYLHPLLADVTDLVQPIGTGTMWECPNFLTFGDRRILIFSAQDAQGTLLYPLYYSGTFQAERFQPHTQGMLAYGGYFYAPQVLRDDQGRYIMWGWLMEGRDATLVQEAGWAGVMSLPIVVEPLPQGVLSLEPAPELTALRQEHRHYAEIELDQVLQLDDSGGTCLEILAEFEADRDSEFGLRLRCSPDGQEQTRLVYRAQQLSIERQQSSINPNVDHTDCTVIIEADASQPLKLHIFLDQSVLEVFVNGRTYLASRIYPQRPDSTGLALFSRSGMVKVSSLDIWRMASIWNQSSEIVS